MAKTYCTCVGMAGEATRRGGKDGCRASVQSYDGSIIVKNYYDENDNLKVIVGTSGGSKSSEITRTEFKGTFEEFNNLLELAHDIKIGKVSITRHREKSNRQLKLERAFREI